MTNTHINNSQIYYRLIALWVICEGLIGGIIHGMKIPVSGLIVGSCAVLLICLIAKHIPAKGSILKATFIVVIFKMMLSPQSPPPAYVAVFFQGFMGELLFRNKNHFKLKCVLLGFLALFESAVQRIFVLMIVYGNDFWQAVNEFIRRLVNEPTITNYSLMIAIGYVSLHSLAGIIIGWFAGRMTVRSAEWKRDNNDHIIAPNTPEAIGTFKTGKKRSPKLRNIFIFLWIVLAGIVIQSYINESNPIIPLHISLKIFLRSIFIILTWYLIISPLLIKWMQQWMAAKKSKLQNEINEVLLLLPASKYLVKKSWEYSGSKKGLYRIPFFLKILLLNTLFPVNE